MSRSPRALVLLAVAPLVVTALAAGSSPSQAAGCPEGTVRTPRSVLSTDAQFRDVLAAANASAPATCTPVGGAEPARELLAAAAQRSAVGGTAAGTTAVGGLRSALAQQAALAAAAPAVPGASGSFTPIGKTPLLADDPNAPSVNGEGLRDLAGRVDSYVYDSVHGRLFSAPGTGGVWMSTDLGKHWTSVGDGLPYQSVGSVTWSKAGPAATGTLLVNSGEASAGGNVYTGLGAYWSDDLGKTWHHASGVPDGLMGFEIEVDPSNPKVVYAATSQGLWRSTDTGRSYVNVNLPTGPCAGKTGYDNICMNGNWVTDVEVQTPGGLGNVKGGRVLAVVGYRAGRLPYPGTTTPQSPANGLYRSDTGAPGSFTALDVSGDGTTPVGFAPQERIGRTELGAAVGSGQDHDYVYALVSDAVLFNGGLAGLDAFDDAAVTGGVPNNTALNGIYVSPDWGSSWTRMADEVELQNPASESALIGAQSTAGMYAPGVQSWYNQWIAPDPTRHTEAGVPTRLVFGLEEVWQNRLDQAQDETEAANPSSFTVIGPYFAGESCLGLSGTGLPICPTTMTTPDSQTTHPDQQSGIWVPHPDGSVSLVLGNDGGTYVQTVAAGQPITKDWDRGSQTGYHTLLPYDASAAEDGTVAFGLQDNGSGHITPAGKVVMTFGGDGFYAAIDPENSNVYYNEVTGADMRVTTNGGRSYNDITPPVTGASFANPFTMDPTDAKHLLTAGPEVVERTGGPNGDWVEVFNLDDEGGDTHVMSAVELYDTAAYVGWCQVCDIINKEKTTVFRSGLATNVGGNGEPGKAKTSGWHQAAAKGLPERYITGIAIDPKDPKTVYVTLGGYAGRNWWPEGSFNDGNTQLGRGHVFKSTDAAATFKDITGSLPDTPARSVEIRGNQLLVGTDIGLFLSSDTKGSQWAALKGLPRVPVVSVKNWPGKPDRVVLATFGRGVYSYAFSKATTVPPVVKPPTKPGTGGGSLPATGLSAGVAAVAVVLLLAALGVRRRRLSSARP